MIDFKEKIAEKIADVTKINEDEIGKLCGKEFRIKIVKMIKKKTLKKIFCSYLI